MSLSSQPYRRKVMCVQQYLQYSDSGSCCKLKIEWHNLCCHLYTTHPQGCFRHSLCTNAHEEPATMSILKVEYEDNRFLQNTDTSLENDMASYSRILQHWHSSLWELKVLHRSTYWIVFILTTTWMKHILFVALICPHTERGDQKYSKASTAHHVKVY